MVPITDVMFLASKPRKIFFFRSYFVLIEYIIYFLYYKNLFLARPKPSTSTVKSRLNSDNGTVTRSRPAAAIPSRTAAPPVSAGK